MRQGKKRPTTRRRGTLAGLVLILPAFAIAAGLTAVIIWLIENLQSARCPAGTFLSGSGTMATVGQYVSVFFAALLWGLVTANFLTHAVAPVRAFLARATAGRAAADYTRSQRELVRFCVLASAVLLPVAVAATLTQFCLFPEGIAYQPYPWTGLGRYQWQDVAAIETSCSRARRGWSGSFVIVLRDRRRFDIMAWPPEAVHAYPQIAQALAHGDFKFDRSRVRAGCDVPYREMLTRRP